MRVPQFSGPVATFFLLQFALALAGCPQADLDEGGLADQGGSRDLSRRDLSQPDRSAPDGAVDAMGTDDTGASDAGSDLGFDSDGRFDLAADGASDGASDLGGDAASDPNLQDDTAEMTDASDGGGTVDLSSDPDLVFEHDPDVSSEPDQSGNPDQGSDCTPIPASGTLTLSGDNSPPPSWNRPLASCTSLSSVGLDVGYAEHVLCNLTGSSVSVDLYLDGSDEDGALTCGDPFLLVYNGTGVPTDPLGCVAGNDDGQGPSAGSSVLDFTIAPGQRITVAATAFDSGDEGTYEVRIAAP